MQHMHPTQTCGSKPAAKVLNAPTSGKARWAAAEIPDLPRARVGWRLAGLKPK